MVPESEHKVLNSSFKPTQVAMSWFWLWIVVGFLYEESVERGQPNEVLQVFALGLSIPAVLVLSASMLLMVTVAAGTVLLGFPILLSGYAYILSKYVFKTGNTMMLSNSIERFFQCLKRIEERMSIKPSFSIFVRISVVLAHVITMFGLVMMVGLVTRGLVSGSFAFVDQTIWGWLASQIVVLAATYGIYRVHKRVLE